MSYKIHPSTLLKVVIPSNQDNGQVDAGSGIVAIEDNGKYCVYYEGNRFGAENLQSVDGRLMIAASRLLWKSPTVASHTLSKVEFELQYITVGTFRYEDYQLEIIPDFRSAWNRWVESYFDKKSRNEAIALKNSLFIYQKAAEELNKASSDLDNEKLIRILSDGYPFADSFDEELVKVQKWTETTMNNLNRLQVFC